MANRSVRERLGWGMMALAPTFSVPFVMVTGPGERELVLWAGFALTYLFVLGETYHQHGAQRHASAVLFTLLSCVLNVVVAVGGMVLLLSSVNFASLH